MIQIESSLYLGSFNGLPPKHRARKVASIFITLELHSGYQYQYINQYSQYIAQY